MAAVHPSVYYDGFHDAYPKWQNGGYSSDRQAFVWDSRKGTQKSTLIFQAESSLAWLTLTALVCSISIRAEYWTPVRLETWTDSQRSGWQLNPDPHAIPQEIAYHVRLHTPQAESHHTVVFSLPLYNALVQAQDALRQAQHTPHARTGHAPQVLETHQ